MTVTEEPSPVVNETADTQVTAPAESTPVETKEPVLDEDGIDISFDQDDGQDEVEETPEAPKPETDGDEVKESEADADKETDDPSKQQEQSKADARKEKLNLEIRDLVTQRNTIRQEVEALNAQVYKPASVEELAEQVNPETGEYYNRLEAQVESMRQEQEVAKYNNSVTESRVMLTHEASKAIQDFPMFDENSPEYKPAIAADVDKLLAKNLIFDKNTGQVVGAHASPYSLYQTAAAAYQLGAQQSAADGQKAVEKMMTNVDIPPTAPAPKKSAKDDAKLSADEYADKHGLKFVER